MNKLGVCIFLVLLITLGIIFNGCQTVITNTVTQTQTRTQTNTLITTVIPNVTFATALARVPVYTQPNTGGIIGTVVLKNGQPAVDYYIYLFSDNSDTSLDVEMTDWNGHFIFNNVVPGNYSFYYNDIPGIVFFSGKPVMTFSISATVINVLPT